MLMCLTYTMHIPAEEPASLNPTPADGPNLPLGRGTPEQRRQVQTGRFSGFNLSLAWAVLNLDTPRNGRPDIEVHLRYARRDNKQARPC